eukprot:4903900-Heterocapsa_arctica.AAC.1
MCRMRPHAQDPFGLWMRKPRNIPWRECPMQFCTCEIPAAYTACPYCHTPLVFTIAPVGGAERRMHVAAAAVARAVP